MDPRRKDVEEVITPDKTPKGSEEQSKPPKPSASKRKEKKTKKHIYKLRKLLASFWWIVFIVTFVVGSIGLINLILSLYLRGGPDLNYILIITTLGRDVQMIVYGFEGHKRNLNIRMQSNITYKGRKKETFENNGVDGKFKEYFKKAEEMIPWLSRSSSPVIFAGAGDMRLLRKYYKNEYDIIMRDLEKLFKESSLKVLPNSVRTLEDWEEALHGWVTLNYLSDTMIKGRPPIKSKRDLFTTRKTFGLFDLGPTSLHVSYEVPRVLDNTKFPPGVRVITLFGRVYYVYTQTFPCSGAVRIVDKYFTYRYDDKNRTGPHGKFLKEYFIEFGKFAPAYCFNEGDNDYGDEFDNFSLYIGQTIYLQNTISPKRIEDNYKRESPYLYIDHVLRPCSTRDVMVKKRKIYGSGLRKHNWIYYNGEHEPEACKKEVEEMMDSCSKFFTNHEECPVFTIPERPYDVPFIMSNELAVYADMAGIKNGDPKEVWKQKREAICNISGTLTVMAQYPSKTTDKTHYKNVCLMITYLEYVLNKLNLTESEWKKFRFQEDIGHNKIAWQLGYAMIASNALPTNSPYHLVFTLEEIFIQMLVYAGILSFSSLALSLALRNSNTFATRPLELPQQENEINERYFRQFIQN